MTNAGRKAFVAPAIDRRWLAPILAHLFTASLAVALALNYPAISALLHFKGSAAESNAESNMRGGRQFAKPSGPPPRTPAEVAPVFGAHSAYVIMGAGPGGLQLGALMQASAASVDYRVIDKADRVGSFFAEYPRHGNLISLNKRFTAQTDAEFNLRHDWNSLLDAGRPGSPLMRDFSSSMWPTKEEYSAYLEAYAAFHAVRVQLGHKLATSTRLL